MPAASLGRRVDEVIELTGPSSMENKRARDSCLGSTIASGAQTARGTAVMLRYAVHVPFIPTTEPLT
jgi:hypothetical protein